LVVLVFFQEKKIRNSVLTL